MQVWWKTADSGDASFFSQFTEVPRIAGCCVFVNLAWLSTGAGLLVFSVLGHLCLRKAILDMDGPHCAFKKKLHKIACNYLLQQGIGVHSLVAGCLNVIAEFTNGCGASRHYVITKTLTL